MEKKKNKKNISKLEKEIMKDRKMLLLTFISIFLLISLIIVASYFRDFKSIRLSKNNKEIFTISDLTVNNSKYGDSIDSVKKEFGKPIKEEDKEKSIYKYKVLYYDGLVLTFKDYYDSYSLVKAEITSSKYKISRRIKVGKKITKVFRKYKVENNKGAYLYGNYTKDELRSIENNENIYFGIRSSKNVLYVNRDAKVDDLVNNIATLNIEYKRGKIRKITWSYDYE